jgi:hypothetical protein
MSGWDTWDEKQKEYHKSNEKKRERCVKRAKCCFICKVPKGATRIGADGEDYNIFLAAAHLDHDPWNPNARMEALCQDCHNKWDAIDRAKNRKITNSQDKIGEPLTGLKVKGDQDRLRTKNRRSIFADTEWKMRNLKRYSRKVSDAPKPLEQLQMFDEHECVILQVDFPISQFLHLKEE